MAIINTTSYPIYINEPSALQLCIEQSNPTKLFVITDDNTEQLCLVHVLEYLPIDTFIIAVEAGEQFKTIDTAQFIWKSIMDKGGDRHSLIVNLGGGVIGDMGGFCASTYMRGIPFIQMPTTLLSQVDSSVGSKLGIDFNNAKNSIGTFEDPIGVIIDTQFLHTLPYKQLLSGFAEVIKHGLIKDSTLWSSLKNSNDITTLDLEAIVIRNVEIKLDVVTSDPFEKGLRKILNFGHTIGHAIEILCLPTDYPLLHGEAIAIGMVCEAYLSSKFDYITFEECEEIKHCIKHLYGDKSKSLPKMNLLLDAMKFDKKNKGGRLMFSLLKAIGDGNYNVEVDEEWITEAIAYYKL